MRHTILSIVVIAGLLASGSPCEWLCQAMSMPASTTEALAHCHTDAQPVAPVQGEPCDEDCASCGVSSTPIPASQFVARTTDASDHTLAPKRGHVGALRPYWVQQRSLSRAAPLPPTDILAITTTLLL
jgi:hypothetical protein